MITRDYFVHITPTADLGAALLQKEISSSALDDKLLQLLPSVEKSNLTH